MAWGTGTALGVAVVALALHAGARLRYPDAGLTLSMAALAAVALAGVSAAQRGSRVSQATSGGPR